MKWRPSSSPSSPACAFGAPACCRWPRSSSRARRRRIRAGRCAGVGVGADIWRRRRDRGLLWRRIRRDGRAALRRRGDHGRGWLCAADPRPRPCRRARAGAAGALWRGALNCLPAAGLLGSFAAGIVLAFAWAPCVGPTLGAAFALAASGGSLAAAMATMFVFALGAALALLAAGFGLGKLAGRRTVAPAGRASAGRRWLSSSSSRAARS